MEEKLDKEVEQDMEWKGEYRTHFGHTTHSLMSNCFLTSSLKVVIVELELKDNKISSSR